MKIPFTLIMMLCFTVPVFADEVTYAAGKKIFESRCADTCHQTPAVDSLKPKQWRIVLNTMQKRMERAGMARLNAEEFDQLLHYLTAER